MGLKFRGWVAGTKWTRTVPHIGVRPIGGAWWRGVARAPPTTIPCYISKKAGSIEYKFGMQGH